MSNFKYYRFKVSEERLKICKGCEKYHSITSQCSECGCIMLFKTLLQNVSCPIGKWGPWEDKLIDKKPSS